MTVLHLIVANAPDLAASTRERYRRDLDAWVKFAGPNPSGWTPESAEAFYASLLARGMRPQSANRLFASIGYAAKWWAQQQRRPELDFTRIRHAKPANRLAKYALTDEQAYKLVQACVGPTPIDLRDFALVVVGLETGMRRMSIADMTIERTTFRATKSNYPLTMVEMKGHGQERVAVPLSDVAILAMKPWLSWAGRRVGPVFRPIQKRIGSAGPNVYTALTKELAPSTIAKIIAERAEAAGIEHVSPHVLRHTYVTSRAAAGFEPFEIAAMTGHTVSGAYKAQGVEIGAMGAYMDVAAVGDRIRQSTPVWLSELVGSLVR